jgi:hypothetical protein
VIPLQDPDEEAMQMESTAMPPSGDRGDLFADLASVEKKVHKPIYQQEQFTWILKWTHIHLFGMRMIFFFLLSLVKVRKKFAPGLLPSYSFQ